MEKKKNVNKQIAFKEWVRSEEVKNKLKNAPANLKYEIDYSKVTPGPGDYVAEEASPYRKKNDFQSPTVQQFGVVQERKIHKPDKVQIPILDNPAPNTYSTIKPKSPRS